MFLEGHLTASLALTHEMPVAFPYLFMTVKKCLQIFPHVPLAAKLPLVDNPLSRLMNVYTDGCMLAWMDMWMDE